MDRLKIIIFPILLVSFEAHSCKLDEIFISGHQVQAHIRSDSVKVEKFYRKSHCRKFAKFNYFSNRDNILSKEFETKFKSWTKSDQKLIKKLLTTLPTWLKRYKLNKILRASSIQDQPKNPALIVPKSKTLIISDNFFKRKNQKDVLIHEISHVAVFDVERSLLLKFFETGGWSYSKSSKPTPPDDVILADSKDSPSEDFANWVELYYTNPVKLKTKNSKQYQILDKIIRDLESSND